MGRSPSPRRGDRRDRRRKRSRERERDNPRETRARDRELREKRRDNRSRDRSRDRGDKQPARRSRSRSSERHFSKERRDQPGPSRSSARGGGERPAVTEADLEGKSHEEREMMKLMGFCGFDTTKNKKVEGNEVGDVHVILKRKYRQYMNRKGGFNRPLDFVA